MQPVIYKRGLNRFIIIKNYSFDRVIIKEWGVNMPAKRHDLMKDELKNGLESGTITKL